MKNPLGPPVVARVGGIDFATPVDGETDSLDLSAEVLDVGLCGRGRMGACLDGELLCREAEGIPTHGVEDVKSAGCLVAGKDIGCGVTFRMPDVQTCAGGVGKHVQHVLLRPF